MKQIVMSIKQVAPENVRKSGRVLVAMGAALYYRFPSRKLKIIAVTGTSGKSTTANLIYHVLKDAGISVGVISTNGVMAGDRMLDTGLHTTTPDPLDLQRYLRFMKKKKIEWVVLESSSHALAQGRLGLLKFEYSVITNIKRDHLDWHKTWENYARAKTEVGIKTKKGGKIVINRDDKEMFTFVTDLLKAKGKGADILSYSFSELQNIMETYNGSTFTLTGQTFFLPILGKYNIENALAAINIGHLLGLSSEQINTAFNSFKGLVGRMQVMKKEPFVIIVDFAHNTDSLRKSLESARKLVDPGGRLICIFGSAGLRDVEKRFTMGETSAELSDITIIAAEDPRTENLFDINNQILEGANRKNVTLVKRFAEHREYEHYPEKIKKTERNTIYIFDEERVQNRFDAIEFAIKNGIPGDVIITEGKGHEKSLCFGEIEYPFTDQDAVKKALEKLPEEMKEEKFE